MPPRPRLLLCLVLLAAAACGGKEAPPSVEQDPHDDDGLELLDPGGASIEVHTPDADIQERSLPPEGSRNLLLITVDTLRADHLSCYGYNRPTSPRIDALARDGIRFQRAQSQRSLTWPSLSSILSGRYPRTHLVRRNGDRLSPDVPTMPRILRAHGWVAAAAAASMKTAPDPGVDVRFASQSGVSWPEQDRQVTRAAVTWMEKWSGRPWVLWVHLIGPHDPYAPDPPYRGFFDAGYRGPWNGSRESLERITSRRIVLAPEDLAHIAALYDGEIRATDALVGDLLDTLDRTGVRDRTTVVFTADHGEELYQRNFYFMHGCSMYDSVLHVPLIIRSPGTLESGRTIAPTVELIDIAPTVLPHIGVPFDGAEGINLAPLLAAKPAKGAPSEPWPRSLWDGSGITLPDDRFVGGERFSVAEYRDRILTLRTDTWRYVWNPDEFHPHSSIFRIVEGDPGYAIAREELYRTADDPLEKNELSASEPEQARLLREALLDWASRRGNVMVPKQMDEATRNELRSLGYIK